MSLCLCVLEISVCVHFKLVHERMTSSINEPVNQRSRLWVQCSLKQPSLLNDASTRPPLLFNPQAKANLKRKDNASTHSLLRGRHTSSHAQRLSHTQRTHTDYSSPTLPQCSQTFMSVGLYLFPTLDVQSAASGSAAADRVSLRCSQAHQAFCFYSVWFHFVFRVMSFSCFEPQSFLKRQPSEKKKRTHRWVCVWIM